MINGNTEKKRSLVPVVIGIVFCVIYGVACTYLYYMQSLELDQWMFESDLPAHIRMAVEDHWGYSLTAYIYCFFNLFQVRNLLIALFLALCTIAALVFTYFGVSKVIESKYVSLAVTLLSGFVMPFFIQVVHYQRYIGYQSPSIWHNSTYIVMKAFGIAAIVYYWFKLKPSGEGLSVKTFTITAVLLTLTTATKTSFIVVFAPALIISLFFDLWCKIPFKKLFCIGMTMFPSLIVILIQKAILFDDNSGVEIRFGYTLFLHTDKAPITMVLSALFPVLIFLFNVYPVCKQLSVDCSKIREYRRLTKEERAQSALPKLHNRAFLMAWLIWLFGALEIMFLCETGERADAANFSWGYFFALFVVYVESMIRWLKNVKDTTFLGKIKAFKYGYAFVTLAVLLYQVFCGFVFYTKLLQGTSYFM